MDTRVSVVRTGRLVFGYILREERGKAVGGVRGFVTSREEKGARQEEYRIEK